MRFLSDQTIGLFFAVLLTSSFTFLQAKASEPAELKIGVTQEFDNLHPMLSTMTRERAPRNHAYAASTSPVNRAQPDSSDALDTATAVR